MIQSQRTLQEYRCTLPPADVLARAKNFFTQRNSIYASFLDMEGPSHVTFRGQGTEELVIAVAVRDGVTLVTGSSYLFDMQISRFFSTLPSPTGADEMLPALPART